MLFVLFSGSSPLENTVNDLYELTMNEYRGPIVSNTGLPLSNAFPYLSILKMNKATSIGDSAFRSAASLTRIEIENVRNIGSYAFYSCPSISTIKADRCEKIGQYAFYCCSSGLSSVSFKRCTYIDFAVFYSCYKLSGISLPNLVNMSGYAFASTSIVSIYLPNLINTSGSSIFANCSSLKTVELPNIEIISRIYV